MSHVLVHVEKHAFIYFNRDSKNEVRVVVYPGANVSHTVLSRHHPTRCALLREINKRIRKKVQLLSLCVDLESYISNFLNEI